MNIVEVLKQLHLEREKHAELTKTLRDSLPAPGDVEDNAIYMAGQMDGVAYGLSLAMEIFEGKK